jgi:glycosyltransferase involved in cell wall biosynthesis
MRILQVSDLYPPVTGGLELAVQCLANGLASRGHEVTVLTQPLDGRPSDSSEGAVRVIREPALIPRVVSYQDGGYPLLAPFPDPVFMAGLRRVVRRNRPHVIHVHGWASYSVLATPGLDTPVVVGLHDYGHVCPKRTLIRDSDTACAGPRLRDCVGCAANGMGTGRGPALAVALHVGKRLHSRAAGFIANSHAVLTATRPALPAGVPAEVIPPSPPVCHPSPVRPGFLPAGDGFVLFVGGLGRHKGIDVLLDVWASGPPPADLVVIGTRNHLPPLRIPERTTVVPAVPHDDVLAAFRHCSFAVVPSVWAEPFGLVAVEAMTLGKAVVASDAGGLSEIIDHEVTGLLVTPGDRTALAGAVRSMLDDPVRTGLMGAEARRRARRWSQPVTTAEVESFYHHVLSERGAA